MGALGPMPGIQEEMNLILNKRPDKDTIIGVSHNDISRAQVAIMASDWFVNWLTQHWSESSVG